MVFNISAVNLINLIGIAAGIGICGLSFLQITSSAQVSKEVRRYFQCFLLIVMLYLSAHLARQLMDGLPGSGVRFALQAVTFIEMLAAGLMTHMISMLLLAVAKRDRTAQQRPLQLALTALLLVHGILLVIGCFNGLIYYFDAANAYHRGGGYLLSNLSPLAMLVIDVVLLLRCGSAIDKKVRSAFWVYVIAPLAAIGIQSVSYGVQFIIFATVGAAVYMFQAIVRVQNERFSRQQVEHSRMEAELNMAASIQASMLPSTFPAFPEREEFDVFASMDPAKEVGGDFYDFFFVDNDHLGIVIADVSGKGVPAALFMMISKIVIQNYAVVSGGAAEALEAANRQICANNHEGMFVTVWLGILDLKTGSLTAANAGHEYPVLKKAREPFELVKDKHGLVLGAMEFSKYRSYTLQLAPGDMIFLYTDGIPEATNGEQQLFGTDRMLEALNRLPQSDPKAVLKQVRTEVDAFVGEAPQFDDLTMLCLKYNGHQQ